MGRKKTKKQKTTFWDILKDFLGRIANALEGVDNHTKPKQTKTKQSKDVSYVVESAPQPQKKDNFDDAFTFFVGANNTKKTGDITF